MFHLILQANTEFYASERKSFIASLGHYPSELSEMQLYFSVLSERLLKSIFLVSSFF